MTAQLSPPPVFRAFDNSGAPLAFGQLFTYAAGTSAPQATYVDSSQTTPNTNPIILNARGEANVWLDPNLTYKFILAYSTDSNPPTNPIWTVNNIAGGTSAASLIALLTAQILGQIIFPQSLAEINAGSIPTYYNYYWGDVRRFGAVLDGVADDWEALQRWANVGGNLNYPVAQTALITAPIVLKSNTTLNAVKGAMILTNTPNISLLTATLQTDVVIRGLHFKQTIAGATPYVGHVVYDRCTNSIVEECEFEGAQFYGIWGPGSTYCTYRTNYFHDALGVGQDSADIDLSSSTTPSRYNIIDGNTCWGGLEFGIAVWDQYTGIIPSHNIISHNRIGGGQTGYGILLYFPAAGDSYNQVIGNSVQDVQGSIASNPSSGAGIYVVGLGAGGTLVESNTIFNCCRSTANASLAPGGIGISGTAAGSAPITIQGNVIGTMTQYHGIIATGCLGGVTISGNTILQPAANTTGHAILVTNCDYYTVTGNTITQVNTTTAQRGILLYANGANCTNGTVTANTIRGGHQSYIETAQASGFLVSGLTLSGNVGNAGDDSLIPLLFSNASCADVEVSGNYFSGGNAAVVSQSACTNVRYVNNRMKGTGTIVVNFTGTNTGSFYDRSNAGSGIGAGVNNAGTGLIIEQLGTTVPAAGTWARGDTIRNSAPAAAGVYEWVCTIAGTGGGTAVFNTISNT